MLGIEQFHEMWPRGLYLFEVLKVSPSLDGFETLYVFLHQDVEPVVIFGVAKRTALAVTGGEFASPCGGGGWAGGRECRLNIRSYILILRGLMCCRGLSTALALQASLDYVQGTDLADLSLLGLSAMRT
jgi:hypothetical protein